MTRRTLLKLSGVALLQALVVGCSKMAQSTTMPSASSSPGQDIPANNSNSEATVKVKVYNRKGQLVGPIEMPRVVKTDAQWQAQLTQKQYEIARAKGTEPPFCGNLLDNHQIGTYSCICCRLPLFSSDAKFNSGTGWPSFFQPVSKENVAEQTDRDGQRTEILCARCDCHIGHVFDDGPRPTGLRFCCNSESLFFTPEDQLATLADPAADKAAATTQPART